MKDQYLKNYPCLNTTCQTNDSRCGSAQPLIADRKAGDRDCFGKTEVVIPVSCVEQGRWKYRTETFASGKKMMHASLRREHQEDVKFSLKCGRGYQSDQSRIWDNISEKSARMNVESPTHAMADVYENYEDKLSAFKKEKRGNSNGVGYQRFSQRRRRR